MLPTRRATVVSPFLIAVLLRLGFLPRLLSARYVASTVGTLAIRLPILALCVAWRRLVEALVLRPLRYFPITGRRTDLQFVEFVPLRIGAITIRNREQLTDTTARIYRLRIIHAAIITHRRPVVQAVKHGPLPDNPLYSLGGKKCRFSPIIPSFFRICIMWFKNLQLYRLPKDLSIDISSFEEQLSKLPLQPCTSIEPRSMGWIPPREGGPLVHGVNHQWLIALGFEERLLPASIVKQFAADRAKAILENEGRKVGRKEMRDIREATAIELMPRAFPRRRVTYGWIDPVNGWLVIDAGSAAKAEEFLEHLRRSVDSFPAKLVKTVQSPVSAMTEWVADGDAPGSFTIDQDLELRSAENAAVRYVKHTLEGDEIRQHIATGKIVTKLGLTWGERISFVLNENLQLKRLAFLDILKEQADGQAENEDERFDIDFTLMTGEVAQLLADLLEALGGELPGAI